MTMMATIFLSLGSNLGDRKVNLRRALRLLSDRINVDEKSSVYETEPMYFADQANFFNMVIRGKTELAPDKLLHYTQGIEQKMGRDPNTHNRPRIIDLDILFYDNETVDVPDLVIPHPRIAERAFILVPMNDIAPKFVHPIHKLTISEILQQIPDWTVGVRRTTIRV